MTRRRLKNELVRLRETAGVRQTEVTRKLDWSASKLARIESGSVGISTVDLRAMLALYRIDDAEKIQELEEVARLSREKAWWHAFRNVTNDSYGSYIGHESSASIVRAYQPEIIPGLLQTKEYASEVVRATGSDLSEIVIDSVVELRMERQKHVEAGDPNRESELDDDLPHPVQPVHRTFIISQAAMFRVVGGYAVMRQQLERIREEVHSYSEITVRVEPLHHGLHLYSFTPYILLEFPDPANELVLYLEGAQEIVTEGSEGNKPEGQAAKSPNTYRAAFLTLADELDQNETLAYLDEAIERLDQLRKAGKISD